MSIKHCTKSCPNDLDGTLVGEPEEDPGEPLICSGFVTSLSYSASLNLDSLLKEMEVGLVIQVRRPLCRSRGSHQAGCRHILS